MYFETNLELYINNLYIGEPEATVYLEYDPEDNWFKVTEIQMTDREGKLQILETDSPIYQSAKDACYASSHLAQLWNESYDERNDPFYKDVA